MSLSLSHKTIMWFIVLFTVLIPLDTFAQTSVNFATVVTWSADGTKLATGYDTGIVRIWDSNANVVTEFQAHHSRITALAWKADGLQLATGSLDELARVWDTSTLELVYTLAEHGQGIASIVWSIDGRYLYTGTIDADYAPALRQWDAETGNLLQEVATDAGGMIVSPDGTSIFHSTGVTGVQHRNAATLEVLKLFGLPNDFEDGFHTTVKSISPMSDRIVIGYSNGWVRLWNVEAGQLISQYAAHNQHICCGTNPSEVDAVYFDGRSITTITQDGSFRVWDTVTGALLIDTQTIAASRRTEFSEFGGRLAIVGGETIETSVLENVLILVPDPSLGRLNIIAQGCISPAGQRSVTFAADEAQLSAFTAQIETLSDAQIPPGCKADLLAIIEAIEAQ